MLLMGLRRPSVPARVLLAFTLGAALVAVSLPLLAGVGINFATCPVGWQSFVSRVVAVWALIALVVGLPSWLLALDPVLLAVPWALLALLWKYGPAFGLWLGL